MNLKRMAGLALLAFTAACGVDTVAAVPKLAGDFSASVTNGRPGRVNITETHNACTMDGYQISHRESFSLMVLNPSQVTDPQLAAIKSAYESSYGPAADAYLQAIVGGQKGETLRGKDPYVDGLTANPDLKPQQFAAWQKKIVEAYSAVRPANDQFMNAANATLAGNIMMNVSTANPTDSYTVSAAPVPACALR